MSNNEEYPKVLIISGTSWCDNNNMGNTYSNLFRDWDKQKVAMVYTKAELPQNNVCNKYFQIAENRLIKYIYNKKIKTGVKLSSDLINKNNHDSIIKDQATEKKIYRFFSIFRWHLFLFLRDILWKLGHWKTKELDEFLEDFNADIIFLQACYGLYMNDLQRYVIKKTKKKAVIYFVDDIYSFNKFSFSPFFWINKILLRKSIKKTLSLSEQLYTIAPKQKEEYDQLFKSTSKILNKGGSFTSFFENRNVENDHLKIVYTGNITSGRWRTLTKIGQSLDGINKDGIKAKLYIYTHNHLNSKIKEAFNDSESICFMGGIPSNEVKGVQRNADILVHVESFKLKERLSTRLSFSTKIVDYFESGKCIFAVGWKEAASIDYLINNNAAMVATSENEIEEKLHLLIEKPEMIINYGKKSWACGKRNHQLEQIQKMLRTDLATIVKNAE